MKKLSILSLICVLLITVSLILVACKPSATPPEGNPPTGEPTTPPVTEQTTDYTYEFGIGGTTYKAVYQKAQKAGSSVLKLLKGDTVLTQKNSDRAGNCGRKHSSLVL